jgi:hypothetical protein
MQPERQREKLSRVRASSVHESAMNNVNASIRESRVSGRNACWRIFRSRRDEPL